MLNTPNHSSTNHQPKDDESYVHFYSPEEERLNIITHAFGFIVSVIGSILLINKGFQIEGNRHLTSYVIYAVCIMLLYAASTVYHSTKDVARRRKLNVVDHASIYLMIAGSYTPFTMITLEPEIGLPVLIAIWVIAFFGVVAKLFFTGRYDRLSTLMYVLMGWIILLVIQPMIAALPMAALVLFFAGGISYTIGAIFYSMKKMRFNHVIFHVFVLAGSLGHYLAIYLYV